MSEVKFNQPSTTTGVNFNTVADTSTTDANKASSVMPNAGNTNAGVNVTGGPVLQPPAEKSMEQLKSLGTDALMAMMDMETRKTDLVNSKEQLGAVADQKKHKREEIGKKLNEQIDKEEEQRKASFWTKLFSGIASALGVIASAISICVGVATGCPLLIAAGVIGAVAAVDSFAQTTFGDGALSALLGCFMDKETARTVAGIVDAVAGIACAVGGGIGSGVGISLMIAAGSKIGVACKVINTVSSSLLGVSNIGKGTTTIIMADQSLDLGDIQHDKKKAEAIMQQLTLNQNLTTEHLKASMEMHNKVTEGVKESIMQLNETTGAILTGGAPASA